MRIRLCLLTLAIALVPLPVGAEPTCAGPASGGEWRSYGKDLANTRHQDAETVITPMRAPTLAPAWTLSSVAAGGDGDFTGTPIVADGCVFVGSSTGWVFAANADTGEKVWATKLSAGIFSSAAVSGGRVFVNINREGNPSTAALDQATGAPQWETPVDTLAGTTLYSSPLPYDGHVIVGVSAANAGITGPPTSGKIVFLDQATGAETGRSYTIPPDLWDDGYGGGGVWSTLAIDEGTGYGFVGAGNPNLPDRRHAHNNAVLKLDLDRARPTFGTFVGSFKNNPYENLPGEAQHPDPHFEHYDYGSSPTVMEGVGEGTLIGVLQGSAVHHAFDPQTMQPVWRTIVGPVSPTGNAASPAFDGITIAGAANGSTVYGLDAASGLHRWAAPTGSGLASYQPVASAGGVAYTLDVAGFLIGHEIATGLPLVRRPLFAGATVGTAPTFTLGGISVARNTVYASVGVGLVPRAPGYVIAFRPDSQVPSVPVP